MKSYPLTPIFAAIAFSVMTTMSLAGCSRTELHKRAQLILSPKVTLSQLPLQPSVRFSWDSNQPLTLKVYRDIRSPRSVPVLVGHLYVYNDLGHEVNYAIREAVTTTATTTIEVTSGRLSEEFQLASNSAPILPVGQYHATATFEGATNGKTVLFSTDPVTFDVVN